MANKIDTHDASANDFSKVDNKLKLKSLYSKGKRIQELLSISLCSALFIWNLFLFFKRFVFSSSYGDFKLTIFFLAIFLAMVTADFLSGLLHWAADSWGSLKGDNIWSAWFIRPFREHHLDPTSITRHDFVETNGDNFMMVIPILLINTYVVTTKTWDAQKLFFPSIYLLILSLFIGITNQVHKWSHTYFGLPKVVTWLQRIHLILPRQHHRIHHVTPHDTYYCITTGWLNPILHELDFWKRLESIITFITNHRPRQDDQFWLGSVHTSGTTSKPSTTSYKPQVTQIGSPNQSNNFNSSLNKRNRIVQKRKGLEESHLCHNNSSFGSKRISRNS